MIARTASVLACIGLSVPAMGSLIVNGDFQTGDLVLLTPEHRGLGQPAGRFHL